MSKVKGVIRLQGSLPKPQLLQVAADGAVSYAAWRCGRHRKCSRVVLRETGYDDSTDEGIATYEVCRKTTGVVIGTLILNHFGPRSGNFNFVLVQER